MSEGRLASLQFKFEIWLVGQEWVGRQTLKSCMASLTYIFFSGRKPCWENSQIWAAWTCSLQAVTELGAFLLSHLNGDLSSANRVDAQGASHGRAHRIRFAILSPPAALHRWVVVKPPSSLHCTCRLDVRQISQGCDIDGEVIMVKAQGAAC